MRMVLLGLACLSLISATVSAQYIVVPGDADGDMIVSDKEIELAEQSCDEGKITSDELEEIRHIHEAYPITIVDSADRVVTIYKPVERIIIQPTSSYEPIWILGAQDRVVGVTNTAKDLAYTWLPGIQNKSAIGEYNELDYEKIIELNPDIALVSNSGIETKKIDEILEPAGITVVGAEFVELETFDSELKNIAEILEAEERAEDFLAWRNEYINSVKEKTNEIDPRVRVYGEWAHVERATGGKTSAIDSTIKVAGGDNIAGDLDEYWIVLDPEFIMTENPEVIFFAAWEDMLGLTGYYVDNYEGAMQFVESATNRTDLKDTSAVQNGGVYVLDAGCVLTSARNFVPTLYLAKWFYPDRFEDLDPENVHKEYFEKWLGIPYQGVWAYPQASARSREWQG